MKFEDFKIMLEASGMPEDAINDMIVLVEPCFDFRDFMKKKYGLDDEAVESLTQLKIAAKQESINEGLEMLDVEDYSHALISRMSKVIADWSNEEGYEHVEAFEIALRKLLAIGTKSIPQ